MIREPVQALLWDFDGTLVDSEVHWMAGEFELAARHGGDWTPQKAHAQIGHSMESTVQALIDSCPPGDHDPAQWLAWLLADVEHRLSTGPIPWLPGVEHLLAQVQDRGLRLGLVTSNLRPMVSSVLGRLDPQPFEIWVTSEDVVKRKPSPVPYLQAAERLGVPIEACIAIEDSVPGATAARDAGAWVVLVPSVGSMDLGDRGTVLPSLDQVSLDDLLRMRG